MHARREIQSLEMHRRIAELIMTDPQPVIGKAMLNLHSWLGRHRQTALEPVYQEWLGILETLPSGEIAALLVAEDQRAARLRQSSPFAGVLPAEVVWAIKRSHAAA